jgi:SAM-dependent methyltransferase
MPPGPTPPTDPLALWHWLATDNAAPLLRAAARVDGSPASHAQLRRAGYTLEQVAVALHLLDARRKAVAKFGAARAATLIADPEGVEQASSAAAAGVKASRFAEAARANAPAVLDLCCGIGGDTMALRDAGLAVEAVDADPLRAWMAGHNAGCRTVTADVADLDTTGRLIHLDPARRADGRRVFKLADYVPPPAVLRTLVERCVGAAVKLGPGCDLNDVAHALPAGEIMFISERGRLTQAVLWTGALRRHERSAVLLDGATHLLHGSIVPEPLPLSPARRYLLTPDPAAERAGLLHRFNLPELASGLGVLTGDQAGASPWLMAYEVLEELPMREKKVAAWLSAHDGGIVTVKTRGRAADPDRLQAAWRGRGATPHVVFVLRLGTVVRAIICRPPAPPV